jgi:uncharacterized protein YkwD
MSLHRFLCCLFGILVLAACAAAPDVPQPPPLEEQLAELKTEMFAFIVAERSRLNASARPLRLDPLLVDAAQAHSEAMAERGAFDEGGVDGNVAIQHLAADAVFQGYVSESSAMQYFTPEFGIDPRSYARAIVTQWVESEDHRQNIEYGNFELAGVGAAARDGAIFVSGIFATAMRPVPVSGETD